MRSITLALLALLAFVPAGCVSMGPNYDPAIVDSLAVGTDQAEVIELLGRPTSKVTLADGSRQLMWVHSKGSMFGATSRAVTLIFGPDGKYQRPLAAVETNLR
jgi:hypothetical protein